MESMQTIFIFNQISTGYDANHMLIKWFWEAVESYSNEQKLKLLQVSRQVFTCIIRPSVSDQSLCQGHPAFLLEDLRL